MAEQTEQHGGGSAKEGFKKIGVWIKAHPYEAGGVGLLFVLLLVWIHFSRPKAAPVQQQQAGGTDQATMAAELQAEAINAQQSTALQQQQQAAAVAENNNATLLQFGSIQSGTTLGLAQILADIQGQQITTQGSVDLAAITANSANVFNTNSAYLAGLENTNTSNVTIAQANDNAFIQGQSIQAGAYTSVGLANAAVAAFATGMAPAGVTISTPSGAGSLVGNYPSPNQLRAEGFTQDQINNYLQTGHAY